MNKDDVPIPKPPGRPTVCGCCGRVLIREDGMKLGAVCLDPERPPMKSSTERVQYAWCKVCIKYAKSGSGLAAVSELDALRAENEALKKQMAIIVCAFCGKETPRDQGAAKVQKAMATHIVECDKHPMGKLAASHAKMKIGIEALCGVALSDVEECKKYARLFNDDEGRATSIHQWYADACKAILDQAEPK